MEARLPALLLAAAGAVAALAWLWVGRASGITKRLAFRAALLLLGGGLVALLRAEGIFARSSVPFAAALGTVVLLVVVGNLYAVRFCLRCGRMHRNFKRALCLRCGAALPRHGLTAELRRAPLDPADPLGRRRGPARSRGDRPG